MRLPPNTEQELLQRARAFAGLRLQDAALRAGVAVPPDLRRNKGWIGELLETLLGASSASLPQPDFPHLGVELKTLPIDARGRPRESTYVCMVPLDGALGETWEQSWVRRKLARVLWVPVQADAAIPLAERRIGSALLWSPDAHEEALLRRDYEDLMEFVHTGTLDRLSARFGEVMQIRPKAPHGRARRRALGTDGARVLANPRGFYLRASFTAAILSAHYCAVREERD
ncbi:MAG: DNA mismatch repair endonuclease MutH [Gammaproteobacteria bacterium]|nr:DNA mismatch repair endonuclease MutH [Gammaproteobacteria bacterium]